MPLFEMTPDAFRPISQASFADLKVRERYDLQRLLRSQIEVIGDDLYVLTEEFGDWEDSRRRIDLLAIDRQANLVVIELKRTNDGGHMELQAIRYAAMVSAMTFERAEQIHGDFLARMGNNPEDAGSQMLAFLGWEDRDEESFASDVRIVLVSEDFGIELTSAVLWLRDRSIDIQCIRLRPYQDGDSRLIDIQQIIPLPEAQEYQVQWSQKEQGERKIRTETHELYLRFWGGLLALARSNGTRHGNIKPPSHQFLGASSGIRGLNFNYGIIRNAGVVELYIDRGNAEDNKRIFDRLYASKADIESAFGGDPSWDRLDDKRACRIRYFIDRGGHRSPETQWPEIQRAMVEAMTKLESALKPSLDALEI